LACLALAEIGAQAKAAGSGLVKVLADERPEVRLQAAVALGEIGAEAKPAAGALVKLLEDKFEGVRVATVYALGRIGDPSAADVLAKAEQSTDPLQRMPPPGPWPDASGRRSAAAARSGDARRGAGRQEP